MLLGMDEYPYHQITATFAGVGGTDPAWNDGHYLCLSDMAGEVALASSLRLYQNNDVMDGFVCVRHAGKQHNIRVSRRLRPDMGTLARCGWRSSSRCSRCDWCSRTTSTTSRWT